MTISELKTLIAGIEGAVNGRQNKTNFVIVPCEDGIVKISTAVAIDKDTKTHKAFNLEAAIAEYKAWQNEVALREVERANKPAKPTGPNPEAEARRQALDAQIAGLPEFADYTATDIMKALEEGKQVIAAVDGGELIGDPVEERLEDVFVGGIVDHCVVVLGIDVDMDDVALYDPAFGPIPLSVSVAHFLDAWADSNYHCILIGQ